VSGVLPEQTLLHRCWFAPHPPPPELEELDELDELDEPDELEELDELVLDALEEAVLLLDVLMAPPMPLPLLAPPLPPPPVSSSSKPGPVDVAQPTRPTSSENAANRRPFMLSGPPARLLQISHRTGKLSFWPEGVHRSTGAASHAWLRRHKVRRTEHRGRR
jgi:hypothetical protein